MGKSITVRCKSKGCTGVLYTKVSPGTCEFRYMLQDAGWKDGQCEDCVYVATKAHKEESLSEASANLREATARLRDLRTGKVQS